MQGVVLKNSDGILIAIALLVVATVQLSLAYNKDVNRFMAKTADKMKLRHRAGRLALQYVGCSIALALPRRLCTVPARPRLPAVLCRLVPPPSGCLCVHAATLSVMPPPPDREGAHVCGTARGMATGCGAAWGPCPTGQLKPLPRCCRVAEFHVGPCLVSRLGDVLAALRGTRRGEKGVVIR